MQYYKAKADSSENGKFFKEGDLLKIDWDHYDTELAYNLTAGFTFGPVGRDIDFLESIIKEELSQ